MAGGARNGLTSESKSLNFDVIKPIITPTKTGTKIDLK